MVVGGLVLAGAGAVSAGSAPPAPPGGSPGTPVASALTNPRGFTWDAQGNIVVTLAGTGGPNAPTEDTPTNAVIGPFGGGLTGAVATIDAASTCPTAVATGLPSSSSATGEILGAEDVAYLDGELYVASDGGGAGHGNADHPSGVYHVAADGTTELIADLSAWVRANPVENLPPGDFDPDAAGYSMVADPTSGTLWVGDPNSGQIISVTADGTITRVADLSAGHLVPTRLALDPAGGVYVGTLTTVPFPDGAAGVFHVAADGTSELVWSGLTTVVDVAVGADGSLYALELSTGNLTEPPFLTPMSGQIVKMTGADTAEVVAGGLMLPIAMELGPDGTFYVSTPAIGADGGTGAIVRIDPADPAAMGAAPAAACSPIAETLASANADSTPPGASGAPATPSSSTPG